MISQSNKLISAAKEKETLEAPVSNERQQMVLDAMLLAFADIPSHASHDAGEEKSESMG